MTENRENLLFRREEKNIFKTEINLKEIKDMWLKSFPKDLYTILSKLPGGPSDDIDIDSGNSSNSFDILKIEQKIDTYVNTLHPYIYKFPENGKDIAKYTEMLQQNYGVNNKFIKRKEIHNDNILSENNTDLTLLKYDIGEIHQDGDGTNPSDAPNKHKELENIAKTKPDFDKWRKSVFQRAGGPEEDEGPYGAIQVFSGEEAEKRKTSSHAKVDSPYKEAEDVEEDVAVETIKNDSNLHQNMNIPMLGDDDQGFIELCKKVAEDINENKTNFNNVTQTTNIIWFGELKFTSVEQEDIDEFKNKLLNKDYIVNGKLVFPPPFSFIIEECKMLKNELQNENENKLFDILKKDPTNNSVNIFSLLVYLDFKKSKINTKYGRLIYLEDKPLIEPNEDALKKWGKLINSDDPYMYGDEIQYLELLTKIIDNFSKHHSTDAMLGGANSDITWDLIKVIGITNEIKISKKIYKKYTDAGEPFGTQMSNVIDRKDDDTPINRLVSIMMGIANENTNRNELTEEAWYYNWADRTPTTDVQLINKRYRWCFKLEALYVKKHYEILFLFIQINKLYRKIYQMYYILLSLIDLDPSSKNIGAILIPYTHQHTIEKTNEVQNVLMFEIKKFFDQKNIDNANKNLGNRARLPDVKKDKINASLMNGRSSGMGSKPVEESGAGDFNPTDFPNIDNETDPEEGADEGGYLDTAPGPPADEGGYLDTAPGPVGGVATSAPSTIATDSSPISNVISGVRKRVESLFSGGGEGKENLANKIKLLLEQKNPKKRMNFKKDQIISRVKRNILLNKHDGINQFITKDIEEPEEGIPYLGLSDSNNQILKKTKIEIRDPGYYYDMVKKLEKDSNGMEEELIKSKNEDTISIFSSETKLKKKIITNSNNYFDNKGFDDLMTDSNPNSIKQHMMNEDLDLSNYNHVEQIQKYLNRCHYIELLYLKKHNEFMIIYKFFIFLYKKYLIITIILLKYISLLDYKDLGHLKLGVPKEMLKQSILKVDHQSVSRMIDNNIIDDFSGVNRLPDSNLPNN